MDILDSEKLKKENILLREKINKLHKDWLFDTDRFLELKEDYRKLVYDHNHLQYKYNKLNEEYERFKKLI